LYNQYESPIEKWGFFYVGERIKNKIPLNHPKKNGVLTVFSFNDLDNLCNGINYHS